VTALGVGLTDQGCFELPPFPRDLDVQTVNIDEWNLSYNDELIEEQIYLCSEIGRFVILIFDYWSDGIFAPGGTTLTFGDTEVVTWI
jgi:hypothetical protein